MATPKLPLFIPLFFEDQEHSQMFQVIECVDISIIESLAFLLFLTNFPVQGVFESEISLRESREFAS